MSENVQSCSSCGELVPIEYVVCVWCGFDLTADHIRRAGIVIGRREAFQRMKKLARDPKRGAKEIALIPDLTGGKIILYLIGVMMTLNMLAVFGNLVGADFNDADSGITITVSTTIHFVISFKFIVGSAFLLVQPIVMYIIFNFIWKYTSKLMVAYIKFIGGHADSQKVKGAIGYALFPVLIGWTLSLLTLWMASDVNMGSNVDYSTINAAVITVTRGGIGFVGFLFIILGWLATIVLMVILMKEVAKVSWAEAVIIGGIPSIIFFYIINFGTEFLTN